jgi:hypothetical protein
MDTLEAFPDSAKPSSHGIPRDRDDNLELTFCGAASLRIHLAGIGTEEV